MTYHERRHQSLPKIPTTLHAASYIQPRAEEIQTFTRELNVFNGTRATHQSVPRHLRRRQASHFPHRLPLRHVATAMAEKARSEKQKTGQTTAQQMQKKLKRSRRAKRRDFKTFSWEKPQYLRTHIWHAKRCHMTCVGGVHIAERRNDKGLRVIANAASSKAVAYDCSWWEFISCKGKNIEELVKILNETNGNQSNCSVDCKSWIPLSGKNGPLILLYMIDYILIIVHPLCVDSLKNTIQMINQSKQLNIVIEQLPRLGVFEIIGPKAFHMVNQSLDLNDESNGNKLFKRCTIDDCSRVPTRIVLPIQTNIPDVTNPRSHHMTTNTTIEPLRTHKEYFDTIKNEEITNTFEKIVELSNIQKINSFAKVKEINQSLQQIPLLILQNKGNATDGSHFGSSCFVIHPSSFSFVLWRRLIWHCILPIALKEYQYLKYEAGNLSFPQDYIETDQSKQWWIKKYNTNMSLYNNKPKSKRVDLIHYSIDNVNPWDMAFNQNVVRKSDFLKFSNDLLSVDHDSYQKYIKIEIFAVNGKPNTYSYIHIPSIDLLNQFTNQKVVHLNNLPNDSIGRVVNGGYSLRRGVGYGLGYVQLGKLVDIVKNRNDLVLENGNFLLYFRNPFSHHCHLCVISMQP
ncbi:Uncharacterized protein QTN25_005394 [Entamoeba marina]